MTDDERIHLIRNIRWKSLDQDNMEFEARVSCYQRDAIQQLLVRSYSVDINALRIVQGWREHDWPAWFDRRTAQALADYVTERSLVDMAPNKITPTQQG